MSIAPIYVSLHACQRFRERMGKIKGQEDDPAEVIRQVVESCKRPLEKLRKKGGIYRWNYFAPFSYNGRQGFVSINEDRDVVYTVITKPMYDSLKGAF